VTLIESILTTVATQSEQVDLILDLTSAKIGLDDVIVGANNSRRTDRSVFRHPQIRRIVAISSSKLIELGAKGLNSAAFGNRIVLVAPSVEEGLAILKRQPSE
jgi:hypothetical protein